ncbi:MAG: rhodanese-related sulfurtransferase [Leptolyngbya sp. DLM2.Bin15]|nr:MAG: rhodanese-related sulfurtransferase [Leptolyngbya sp. DLM2.Bin15]
MFAQSYEALPQISVEEFADYLVQRQDNPGVVAPLQLIDVREPQEVAIAHLEGFMNLPLSQFEDWSGQVLAQLDPDTETIVMCHHGMRSAHMCQWLAHQGFTHVKNLAGGIAAYAIRVDPSIPQY